MKRVIYISLLLLFPTIVFGENVRVLINPPHTEGAIYYEDSKEVARESFDKQGDRIKLTGKIPDGKIKQYTVLNIKGFEGKPFMEFELEYKNNKLDGLTKGFFPTGKIWLEENYRDGKLDGLRKVYSPTGNLVVKEQYKDGKINGKSIWYFYSNDKYTMNNGDYKPNTKVVYIYEEGKFKSKKRYPIDDKSDE